jgi:hypothetical protein
MSASYRFSYLASAVLVAGVLGAAPASAQTKLPDIIKEPGALNLGGTSFFDGFGRVDTGFSFLQYGHFSDLDNISTPNGKSNPEFNHPSLISEATLEQLSFTTPWHPFGGAVAFSAALPIVNLNPHFDEPGVVLHGNGLGIGDITWGPMFQSAPVMLDGRPVFSWRTQFQVISPAGSFDPTKNINQSSGFWTINPYVAFTVLPTDKLEISARLHYVYNFAGKEFSDPPPVPGLAYRYGQAGQAWFANFDASYGITDKIFAGVNGFYLKQWQDDSLNGIPIPGAKQQFLYLGPGMRYVIDAQNALNLNVYLPVFANNVANGPQFNFQFVHRFSTLAW